MSDNNDILKKRLQLLNKREEVKDKIYNNDQSRKKTDEKNSIDNSNTHIYKSTVEPYQPEELFEHLEIEDDNDKKNIKNKEKNKGNPWRQSNLKVDGENNIDGNVGVIKKGLVEKSMIYLKSIPRYYYDPFHDSAIPIRLGFYCLCLTTIIILITIFMAIVTS